MKIYGFRQPPLMAGILILLIVTTGLVIEALKPFQNELSQMKVERNLNASVVSVNDSSLIRVDLHNNTDHDIMIVWDMYHYNLSSRFLFSVTDADSHNLDLRPKAAGYITPRFPNPGSPTFSNKCGIVIKANSSHRFTFNLFRLFPLDTATDYFVTVRFKSGIPFDAETQQSNVCKICFQKPSDEPELTTQLRNNEPWSRSDVAENPPHWQ